MIIVGAGAVAFAATWVILSDLVFPSEEIAPESQAIGEAVAAGGTPVDEIKVAGVVNPVEFPRVLGVSSPEGNVSTNAQVGVTDSEDEKLMNEIIEGLLTELAMAKASGNAEKIRELVKKLKSLDYGSKTSRFGRGAGAAALKLQVLGALAGAGPAGLIEVVDFIGDSELPIVQRATDILFENLQDVSLGDADRAEIVIAASEEMTNENNLRRLYQEFINMRHSVGSAALIEISKSGTAEAKSMLPNAISAFTGDTSIGDASQLDDWLDNNPDSDRDEWFYGPKTSKDN